jgi:hypothetical protein
MDDDNARAMFSERGDPAPHETIPQDDPYNERVSQNPAVGLRTDSQANRVAQDYLHAKSPEGIDVVFTPGEALPEWARKIQAERLEMAKLDDPLYGSAGTKRARAEGRTKSAHAKAISPKKSPATGTDKN